MPKNVLPKGYDSCLLDWVENRRWESSSWVVFFSIVGYDANLLLLSRFFHLSLHSPILDFTVELPSVSTRVTPWQSVSSVSSQAKLRVVSTSVLLLLVRLSVRSQASLPTRSVLLSSSRTILISVPSVLPRSEYVSNDSLYPPRQFNKLLTELIHLFFSINPY